MVSLCGTAVAQMDFPFDPKWHATRLRYGACTEAYEDWKTLDYGTKSTIAYGVVAGKEVFAEYVMYFYGGYQVNIDLTNMRPNTMNSEELVALVDRIYLNPVWHYIPYADIMINCEEWDNFLRRK